MGKVKQSEGVATGSIVPTVRKQREINVGAEFAVSLVFSLRLQPMDDAAGSRKSLTDTSRCLFSW